ncbi:type IV pilin [Methanocorpusculum sp. MG]|uniref:Type IV pilin n=1 Tax=Methanocorpusculum petauri TaxID=3002863 RepID=A0ABT4IE22_9EURY|nr:type IV pilin [Methanocorpusculum petauri]MCZ0859986.1 type IV pilin [Methanocorpusculum petauri]
MTQNTKDNGVSPVIAVLLILAITVVAAGVVAVVATGMTGELQNGKQVGLIVKPAASGGDVLVTVVSGKDVPELTKLEVIDGGSADAVFREVRLSDGGDVTSFTAGAGYVAKSVAWPSAQSIGKPYLTPVLVKGLFRDGTEVVLLNTKLTFVGVKSHLDGVLISMGLKDFDKREISENIADLFLSGSPIWINASSIIYKNGTGNRHNLLITVPQAEETSDQYLKMSGYVFWSDGTLKGYVRDSLINKDNEINIFASELDKYKDKTIPVGGVKVIVNSYDKKEYEKYLEDKRTYEKATDKTGLKEPAEPEPIGYQEGIIYIDHSK